MFFFDRATNFSYYIRMLEPRIYLMVVYPDKRPSNDR